MLTQNDLQAIAKLIKIEVDSVRRDMATKSDLEKMATKRDIERLDIKFDTYFEVNRKEHSEITEMLVESNEDHGKRLDRLELHTGLVKPHKN